MKIVSTTLAGHGTASIIGGALRSVAPIVDSSLVIWTGGNDSTFAEWYQSFATTVEPFALRRWQWQNDFGQARQIALDFARNVLDPGDWSVMVDTDERVICPDPAALRVYLAALPAEVQIVCAFTASGVLQRERFFRGNIKARWYLRTHETIDVTPEQQTTVPASIITWDELPKSTSDIEMRCKRDLGLLALDLLDYPDNPRVLYYIGQANEHLWRNEEALAAYRRVSELCGGEAAAWACYCAARIHMREPADPLAAYGACIAAIAREPRMAEPYHLAGAICVDGGRPEWGEAFGKMAKIHGEGTPGAAARGGFRWPHALGAGPDQMIAHARAAMAATRGIGAVADSVETSGERRVVEMVRDRVGLARSAIVFDVGANRGQWARMARGMLGPSAEIHCFEPGHVSREIGPDVTEHVHEIALGNEDGTTFLRWDVAGSGLASLHVRPGQTDSGRVNIQRIDEWCPCREIDRIDLLKIDVEGHEIHVLRGASGMLDSGKIDAIQFEFGGACIDSRAFLRDFFDLLVPHGFEIHRVTPTGLEGPIVYSEREEIFVSSNFLAVKRGSLAGTRVIRIDAGGNYSAPSPVVLPRATAIDPVRALIFSRDRPMQLDACLRSLRMHCRDAESLPVHILFRWTSEEYAQAYRDVAAANPWAIFMPEVGFEADTRAILAGCDHVLFVVDDSIFVRSFSITQKMRALDARPDAIGYALRLGIELERCYPTGAAQVPPEFTEEGGGTFSFSWPEADGDYGYPLEVSSSLYRAADVRAILRGVSASSIGNPNALEHALAINSDHRLHGGDVARPRLLCSGHPVAFSVPANRVQGSHANRAGTDPALSADALLRQWQDGWQIDVATLAGHVPAACHEEIAYRFERRPTMGPIEFSRMAPTEQRVEVAPISITVTSTGKNAEAWAGRCISSVGRQTVRARHVYVAADATTYAAAAARHEPVRGFGLSLLANLLPAWRSLPPEDVIVWLDGDDWLATDRALDRVAAAHGAGALVTYGSFMYSDGRPGFAGQCGTDPRSEPWRATHLKSFRAGLVQRIRDEDLRWPGGEWLDLAIDQAVMLPVLEMAGRDRSIFIPEILAVYNEPHGFAANADAAGLAREAEAVRLVRGRKRYERIVCL